MNRGAEVHDVMEALRRSLERNKEARRLRERQAEFTAILQDDPPEWWDEDEDSQVPGVGSKVSPNGL